MNINDIITELNKEKTNNYKEFSSKLIPSSKPILGVRVPILRTIAKKIVKDDPISFLENNNFSYYELEMLHAMVIGYMKTDILTKIYYADKFIPIINNWSVCDTFCQTFKDTLIYPSEVMKLLKKYLSSKKEFELRVVVVMFLSHYLNDEFVDDVIKIVDTIKHDGYYYKMGAAWLIATIMAKYPSKCFEYLENNNLDDFVINKSIQKMNESFRVSIENKQKALKYKRKKEL